MKIFNHDAYSFWKPFFHQLSFSFGPPCGFLNFEYEQKLKSWAVKKIEPNTTILTSLFLLTKIHLLAMQMPRGVPVATVAINNATNAGLLAVRILGAANDNLLSRFPLAPSSFLYTCEVKFVNCSKIHERGMEILSHSPFIMLCRMSQYQEDQKEIVMSKGDKLEKHGWESYLNSS